MWFKYFMSVVLSAERASHETEVQASAAVLATLSTLSHASQTSTSLHYSHVWTTVENKYRQRLLFIQALFLLLRIPE